MNKVASRGLESSFIFRSKSFQKTRFLCSWSRRSYVLQVQDSSVQSSVSFCNTKTPGPLKREQSNLLKASPMFQRFSIDSAYYQSKTGGNEPNAADSDATSDKQKKSNNNYALLIGSVVALIGLGYVSFQKFMKAKAEPGMANVSAASGGVRENESKDDLIVGGKQLQEEKEIHKSKAGFRERKV